MLASGEMTSFQNLRLVVGISVCYFTLMVEPDQQYLLLLQASHRPGRREDWEQRPHIHSDFLQCFRKGLWELYLCGHKQAWKYQRQHHTVWWVQEAWMQWARPGGRAPGLWREEGSICLACVHPYCSTHHPLIQNASPYHSPKHVIQWCLQRDWYLLVHWKARFAPYKRSKPNSEPSWTVVAAKNTEPWNSSTVVSKGLRG